MVFCFVAMRGEWGDVSQNQLRRLFRLFLSPSPPLLRRGYSEGGDGRDKNIQEDNLIVVYDYDHKYEHNERD